MQIRLKSSDNVYKKNLPIYSYLTFQWEVNQINGYFRDTGPLWNEKVVIFASGEILFLPNNLHDENIYS